MKIKELVLDKVNRSEYDVFMRKDFLSIGSYQQVVIVLKELCQEQKLIKIGRGLYAKAAIASEPPLVGEVYIRIGIIQSARQALERLGYQVVPTSAENDYNDGVTTQVPTGRKIGINGAKPTRKIGNKITYEYGN
jgi:Family of unknown function (DUF6088)